MNIFVLCTGRCGSTTFIRACSHIENYTSSHESRTHMCGNSRLNYPDDHIEADNRLSWFLGRLDEKYGNDAFYVHLKRGIKETSVSFSKRYDKGIMKAYREGILLNYEGKKDVLDVCRDYCLTVNKNIELFLKDKDKKMKVNVGSFKKDFKDFWDKIDASGNINSSIKELEKKYNKSSEYKIVKEIKKFLEHG